MAVANQILVTCSEEQLENAVAAFMCGDPIRLKPHKPIDIQDYGFIAERIERALTYRPRRTAQPKPKPEYKPSAFPNLFTVTVPMTMDISKLSDMERQILCQNMDKMLLITVHQPKAKNGIVEARTRIGIAIRHLHPEQKEFINAKEDFIKEYPIDFYKKDVAMACLIFSPTMLHHFYRTLLWRNDFFGIPP